jgi:formylmethanofuran dehydrogenase subunit B
VVLPTSITGIESGGLVYRLDQVPIELGKIINPANNLPSDAQVLTELNESINQGGSK